MPHPKLLALLAACLCTGGCTAVGSLFSPAQEDEASTEGSESQEGEEQSGEEQSGDTVVEATDVGGPSGDAEWGETGATRAEDVGATWGDGDGDGDGDTDPTAALELCSDTCGRLAFCGVDLGLDPMQCMGLCAQQISEFAPIGPVCIDAFADLHLCLNTLSCLELQAHYYDPAPYPCEPEHLTVEALCLGPNPGP